MSWLQLHLVTDKEQAPLVELLFENMGALSVTFSDAKDEPILELGPGETRLWQATRVTALFSGDNNPDDLRSTVTQALNSELSRRLTLEVLEEQSWERAWLDHFHPMRFGQKLWICPSGHSVDDETAVTIDLDPGLAFGTGTHPTTALCLEWLDQADLNGKEIIDFGCGSGILAIAALKLGAKSAVGTDHDPQAIQASQDNAEKNGVLAQLKLFGPGEEVTAPCDIMLANILSGTLINLADLIGQLVKPEGDLLLSGILTSQAEEVMNAYRPNFDMIQIKEQDDWVLLHGRRLR